MVSTVFFDLEHIFSHTLNHSNIMLLLNLLCNKKNKKILLFSTRRNPTPLPYRCVFPPSNPASISVACGRRTRRSDQVFKHFAKASPYGANSTGESEDANTPQTTKTISHGLHAGFLLRCTFRIPFQPNLERFGSKFLLTPQGQQSVSSLCARGNLGIPAWKNWSCLSSPLGK